ncbi:hypothetical protein EV589_5813 [Mycobacterium sp. BK558]|nr:hypothetical protein EV589_5813 [Mycobacterium sp. BK558]
MDVVRAQRLAENPKIQMLSRLVEKLMKSPARQHYLRNRAAGLRWDDHE